MGYIFLHFQFSCTQVEVYGMHCDFFLETDILKSHNGLFE